MKKLFILFAILVFVASCKPTSTIIYDRPVIRVDAQIHGKWKVISTDSITVVNTGTKRIYVYNNRRISKFR